MPTYEYRCGACAHEFEEFQSISAPALTKCPSCGKKSLERLIGRGGGIIFKGGGFYETDYRSDSYAKAAEAEKKSESGAAAVGECCPCGKNPADKCDSNAAKPAAGESGKARETVTPKISAPARATSGAGASKPKKSTAKKAPARSKAR